MFVLVNHIHRSHTDQRLQQFLGPRFVRGHAHEPAEQQHILHGRRTVEDDAPKAQSHVHGEQAEAHERTGEGVQRQPVDQSGRVGRRGIGPDRDPRDDGQVFDGRDRQLRVRPQAGRHQRSGLGVPETREKRVPAVVVVQDPRGGRFHAAEFAADISRASLLATHREVLRGRVQPDHRAPGEEQGGPQRLCPTSDESPRGSGVEPELETRR